MTTSTTLPRLDIPQTSSSETALFRHSPSSTSSVKAEWEPGRQPDEVYDRLLPAWRAWVRRGMVKRLREEKDWMADWQRRIRTERRDKFFYWTAVFGTHTFLTAFLPLFFFFGSPQRGRGMLYVVAMGIYISSFAKDLVCTPRPYSPPVIRLSMSTHHHEYGFPSSHSTNSVSIALFLSEWLWQSRESIGLAPIFAGWSFLLVYAASVVGGRLYTGMHSTADIIGGSLMGVGCWALWVLMGDYVEAWVNTGSNTIPAIVVPLTLALVHFHPEPVDDCPCFEDAVAVLSGLAGSFVGHWYSAAGHLDQFKSTHHHTVFGDGLLPGCTIVSARLVFGIGCIFVFRLIAKKSLLRVLPPIFRMVSKVFDADLPTRRFYTAATDYHQVPPSHFRAIPSLLDLQLGGPSTDVSPDVSGLSSPVMTKQGEMVRASSTQLSPLLNGHPPRSRSTPTRQRETKELNGDNGELVWVSKRKRKSRDERAHYDAEVLTKVGVYYGIGLLSTTLLPVLFEVVERSVMY